MTHVGCWMTYYVHKGRVECPICHKVYETVEQQAQQNQTVTTTFDAVAPQPIRIVIVNNENTDEFPSCRIVTRRISALVLLGFILFMMIMPFVNH